MWLASLLFVLEAYLSVLTVYDVSESGLTFSRGVLSQRLNTVVTHLSEKG